MTSPENTHDHTPIALYTDSPQGPPSVAGWFTLFMVLELVMAVLLAWAVLR